MRRRRSPSKARPCQYISSSTSTALGKAPLPREAFLNRDDIEFAVMDGDIATAGSQGLRAVSVVTAFSRNEALEEAITVSVTVKPTFTVNPPSWLVVP